MPAGKYFAFLGKTAATQDNGWGRRSKALPVKCTCVLIVGPEGIHKDRKRKDKDKENKRPGKRQKGTAG
jgi:hypothetical protein